MRTYIQPTTLPLDTEASLPLITLGNDSPADYILVGDILDCRRHKSGPQSSAAHFTDYMVVTARLWLNVGALSEGLVLLIAPMAQPGMNTGPVKTGESSVPAPMRGDVGSNPTGSPSLSS